MFSSFHMIFFFAHTKIIIKFIRFTFDLYHAFFCDVFSIGDHRGFGVRFCSWNFPIFSFKRGDRRQVIRDGEHGTLYCWALLYMCRWQGSTKNNGWMDPFGPGTLCYWMGLLPAVLLYTVYTTRKKERQCVLRRGLGILLLLIRKKKKRGKKWAGVTKSQPTGGSRRRDVAMICRILRCGGSAERRRRRRKNGGIFEGSPWLYCDTRVERAPCVRRPPDHFFHPYHPPLSAPSTVFT